MAREGAAERAVARGEDRPDPVGEKLRARQRQFEGACMELEYALHDQGHGELVREVREFHTRTPTVRSDRELGEKMIRDRVRERGRTR